MGKKQISDKTSKIKSKGKKSDKSSKKPTPKKVISKAKHNIKDKHKPVKSKKTLKVTETALTKVDPVITPLIPQSGLEEKDMNKFDITERLTDFFDIVRNLQANKTVQTSEVIHQTIPVDIVKKLQSNWVGNVSSPNQIDTNPVKVTDAKNAQKEVKKLVEDFYKESTKADKNPLDYIEKVFDQSIKLCRQLTCIKDQLTAKHTNFNLDDTDEVECTFPQPLPVQSKTKAVLMDLQKKQDEENNKGKKKGIKLGSNTFINCDLRFYNLKYLVDQIGQFEVVHIDPPWRIKGAQRNNSSYMFSNNKFNLQYSTMSNQEIINIPIEALSTKGFCFLWVLNSQMHIGYECMNKWGYEVVDQLTWIKQKNGKVHISHGFYFLHSSETCLVGYKCPNNQYVQFNSKISNNLIIAEVRKKSQKPEQIYTIIDLLMPTANKIELFARNNNLRQGWLSLGNQLGEQYSQPPKNSNCQLCKKVIELGVMIYKSKITSGLIVCQPCFKSETEAVKPKSKKNQMKLEDFFVLDNNCDEDILHEFVKCNDCGTEPINGPRFNCQECADCDLCEICFDKRLKLISQKSDKALCKGHDFSCYEIPQLGNGLATHSDRKCVNCFMSPIVGALFICGDCQHYSMCQNCFFTCDQERIKVRGHNPQTHQIELIVEPRQNIRKFVKCRGCQKMPIVGVRWKCDNCFDFDFCDICYINHVIGKQELKTAWSTAHKQYHTFTRHQYKQAINDT